MSPIHANEVKRSVPRNFRRRSKYLGEKAREFHFGHLAGGHRELAMVDLPQAGDVTLDGNIVGRVRKDQVGAISPQQCFVGFRRSSISAKQALRTKEKMSRSLLNYVGPTLPE